MGKTIIEKIIGDHAGKPVFPGDIVDIVIDVRAARDFGGANVVKNLREHALPVADPSRTLFTFDCNPGGSDQKYATNQQICRDFARQRDIDVYDIDAGIGTHLAMDFGHALPGSTFVSTDSHANILGAIGAFGQGMGDVDIAQAFAFGKVWFKVKGVLASRGITGSGHDRDRRVIIPFSIISATPAQVYPVVRDMESVSVFSSYRSYRSY